MCQKIRISYFQEQKLIITEELMYRRQNRFSVKIFVVIKDCRKFVKYVDNSAFRLPSQTNIVLPCEPIKHELILNQLMYLHLKENHMKLLSGYNLTNTYTDRQTDVLCLYRSDRRNICTYNSFNLIISKYCLSYNIALNY